VLQKSCIKRLAVVIALPVIFLLFSARTACAQHSTEGHTTQAHTSESASSTTSLTPAQIMAGLQPGASYTLTGVADMGSSATTSLVSNNLTITGSGTLMTGWFTEDANSTLNLAGILVAAQSATLAGSTTLAGGTLVSPETTITSTGVLTGSGTIQGNLTSSGTVAPFGSSSASSGVAMAGNASSSLGARAAMSMAGDSATVSGGYGLITVTGNYIQLPGSTLAVRLDPSGNSDRLAVGGTADVSAGNLSITAAQGFYPSGAAYSVLTANGGQLRFNSITQPSNSLVLGFYQDPAGNLLVTRNYQTQAVDPRSMAAALVLNQANALASADMQNVIAALDFADAATITSALSQINGESQNVPTQIAFNSATTFNSAARERVGLVRQGATQAASAGSPPIQLAMLSNDQPMLTTALNSGTVGNTWGAYLRYLGDTGSQAGSGSRTGYDYKGRGFLAGVDKNLADGLILAVNVGFLFSNVNVQDPGASKAQVVSYTIGPYASYVRDNWHADLGLAYTLNNNTMWRNIIFPGVSRQAKSNYFGQTLQGNLYGGYDFIWGNLKAGPVLGLDYAYNTHGTYAESGADSLNQTVNGQGSYSLQAAPGWSASYTFETKQVSIIPEVRGQWVHEFLDDNRFIESSLQGLPGVSMRTPISPPVRDSARLGGALTVKYKNFEFRGQYETNLRQDKQSHSYSLGLKYTF